MKRGDLVTVAVSGDFGKPRPALVVQADAFEGTGTVTVLLITSTLVEAPLIRPSIEPNAGNGLSKPSQIMVDKALSVRRERIGPTIGHIDDETMLSVTRSLALFLGIA
ncbi:type II toxin-antitoxin system PemK/MazF family toxin [Rhizobium daejeonense]|uniref:Type II toxin-antitoxin system PemK/MazF family toxin n=1 Tax=Rhizobium daejeonense TaxID=240521 RepID=A0A6M1S287_9HYPH|nr:type II toxin-antitoxin system PemK/MazF family toxin [Rhizobium daejeonense]NGO63377.1 type II toxin-antitoxin system PemK/MazF family toxin [Rhizobium daejeonense]PZU86589.1 MAG: growth inhibitor PemK [Shinella sp.]